MLLNTRFHFYKEPTAVVQTTNILCNLPFFAVKIFCIQYISGMIIDYTVDKYMIEQ